MYQRAGGLGEHGRGHLIHGIPDHLLAAAGQNGPPGARVEQTEIVVELSRGGDGGARVARGVLLPDGDGGAMPSISSTSGFSMRSRNCRA